MLKEQYRLKRRSAFTATYRTGLSFHKSGVTMFVGKKNSKDVPTKFGFVVSKKIHKRAVKRNRIKRLMRESVRLMLKEGNFQNQYMSVIFAASSKLLGKNFDYVNKSVRELIAKL